MSFLQGGKSRLWSSTHKRFLEDIDISEDLWRSPEISKNSNGLVPTNDFLVVVGITFILWKILLVFRVSGGLE